MTIINTKEIADNEKFEWLDLSTIPHRRWSPPQQDLVVMSPSELSDNELTEKREAWFVENEKNMAAELADIATESYRINRTQLQHWTQTRDAASLNWVYSTKVTTCITPVPVVIARAIVTVEE